MDKASLGILIGMSLGDGSVRPKRKQPSGKTVAAQMYIGHSMQQFSYLEHKSELLRSIFGGKHSVRVGTYLQKSTGKMYDMCYMTKSNPYFTQIRSWVYQYGKKTYTRNVLDMLTPQGIALWYMDDGSITFERRTDGSISGCFFRIATYCPSEEADIIVAYFAEVYGIEVRKHYCKKTDAYTIGGRTKAFLALKRLIEPFVIPSMLYKIEPVAMPSGQERRASSVVCASCGKETLKSASGMCMSCYQKDRLDKLFGEDTAVCPSCGTEQKKRWFKTGICSPCYTRKRKAG